MMWSAIAFFDSKLKVYCLDVIFMKKSSVRQFMLSYLSGKNNRNAERIKNI